MNNLAEICLGGLKVGRNYVRCLAIFVTSIGLGGARGCRGGFKVIILRGTGEEGNPKIGNQFLWGQLTSVYSVKRVLTM